MRANSLVGRGVGGGDAILAADVFPADDRHCGWYAGLPDPPPARRIRSRERADWAVLGAGITGLAAARRLAEHLPDARILLVEAQRVGSGASGRNSGFLTDLGHYEKGLRPEAHRRRIHLARAGIGAVRELVRTHDIKCDWSEGGRLHGAAGDAGMRALERFLRQLEALGEPYEELDDRKLEAITGTAYYRAGARLPGSVLVQPAALVRGLARALPANVVLFEESPVGTVQAGDTLRLQCEEGSIEAPKLLLTTNAFTPALGFLRQRMFPLFVFASLTRVLTEQEQAALGGDREWGLVPEVAVGTTVRRTPDQRILIRNSACYAPGGRFPAERIEKARAAHRDSLQVRFPDLAHVDLEYTWGGVVAISLNGSPFFGRLAPNIFGAAIFNGVGMAMGTALGMLLADLAVGAESDLLRDARSLPRPDWLPPPVLLGLAVRPTLSWMHRQARAEI
jgi:glycine/D-amino acid oxidase-like deaminating enzyme